MLGLFGLHHLVREIQSSSGYHLAAVLWRNLVTIQNDQTSLKRDCQYCRGTGRKNGIGPGLCEGFPGSCNGTGKVPILASDIPQDSKATDCCDTDCCGVDTAFLYKGVMYYYEEKGGAQKP
jgi:hypothetical protein